MILTWWRRWRCRHGHHQWVYRGGRVEHGNSWSYQRCLTRECMRCQRMESNWKWAFMPGAGALLYWDQDTYVPLGTRVVPHGNKDTL